ncbi:hypothetical protein K1X84_03995 [bacterium]|nr:hypothetical protein [bacterium]
MKSHKSILWSVGLLWSIVINGYSQQLYFKYYSLNDGFPHAQVWDIHQDRHGFMWFATGGGLIKYDGVKFRTFTKDDGLVGNVVRSIFQDDDDKLWITCDEGVSIFDGQTFENYTSDDGLGNGFVWETVKDRLGNYWFPTNHGGVSRFNGKQFTNFSREKGLISNDFRAGFIDSRGDLWFGGRGGVAWLKFQQTKYDSVFKSLIIQDDVNRITEDWMGRIIFCTKNGVQLFDVQRFLKSQSQDYHAFITKLTVEDGLVHPDVSAATVTRDSSIWIATDHGLSKYRRGHFHSYFMDENYSSNSLHAVIEDREGTIWVGTNGGGCFKIPYQNIFNFTIKDGLSSNVVNAVTGDDEDMIYIGSDNGLDVYDHAQIRPISKNWLPAGDAVWSLKFDRKKVLWVGSEHHLFEYKNGNVRNRNDIYSITQSTIIDIEESDNGWMWFGTLNGLMVNDGKKTALYSKEKGLPGNQVWSVFKDHHHRIWLGVSGGLVLVQNYSNLDSLRFQIWTKENGLIDNTVNVICEDKNGNLWIGSDLGISHFDEKEFTNYSAKNLGLGDNIVPVIEYDKQNDRMWFGSKGFGWFNYNDNPQLIKLLSKTSGMLGDEATTNNSLYLDQKERVWIGSFSGLTRFQDLHEKAAIAPPVYIKKIAMSDSVIYFNFLSNVQQQLHFSPTGNSIEFEFVALSYLDEKENQYQYKLEGFEENWSDFTKKNEIRYTNLSPGDYTFVVRAQNSEKVFSALPAAVSFSIPAPWWINPWLITITILVISGVTYGSYRFRVNQKLQRMRRRNRELEMKVQERTSEILKQKEELQKILDQLQKTQTQLVQSEKMAALGQLVAGVAHEINNPTSILAGNVMYVDDYVRTLRTLIAQYESQSNGQLFTEIESYKKSVDYEFIKSDLDVLIGSMKNATERIRNIVLDLRNFSRLDEVELNEVDIHDCIDTTVKLFMNQYKHILEINKHYHATNNIFCYVNQINQVLLNLLVNAAQAIEKKYLNHSSSTIVGEINITTENENDGGVIVKIRDNGCGIPEFIRSKVFDPFFTTKPIGQGTGLGLSISYGIIEKHKGRITFDSTINEWTEFSFTLPCKPHEIPS